MNRKNLCSCLLVLLAALAVTEPASGQNTNTTPANKVLAHQLAIATGAVKRQQYEQVISSGVLYPLLLASGAIDNRANSISSKNSVFHTPASASGGCPNVFAGPIGNTRVNQECSLRRQAEEVIAVNPTNSNNLIGGQNDSRLGFNHCGYDFSFDGGKTWADQTPPFYQFIGGDGHTFDACSDPTATFDNAGNAYVGGLVFDISSVANGFVVAKSNAGIGGAFYHTPKASLSFQIYRDTPLGVVANDNDPNVANDKEFIVADAGSSSPKKNNVYATWTRFANTFVGVGGNSPIYFSQSTDGGATWSAGIEISGANAAFCTAFSGEADPTACDQDQGSDPVVGPDGTVYVSFFNGNTPIVGENQHMIVKCPGTADCSNPTNWTAPVQIVTDVGVQPVGPDPVTGCPGGRQCLPPNGYRIDDATFGSLSVDNNGTLYHAFSDLRNGVAGTCTFFVANPAPPCDQDVFYSFSKDGGATWSALFQLTPPASAQWMPWSAVVPSGSTLYVAYYDRSYGTCEFTGCNDITLATISNPTSAKPSIKYTRVTTSSMPNLVVANNPLEAGFLGDYMWVAVGNLGRANVVWADTRGLNGTVEEDIYFASVP